MSHYGRPMKPIVPLTDDQKRMVEDNMGLVGWVISRYYGSALTDRHRHDDLVSYGTLGLIRAVQKFDPGKGFKFSTYARDWVRQAIDRGEEDSNRRRARYYGDDMPAMESLDCAVRFGGADADWTLADILPDPGALPEDDALALTDVSSVVDLLADVCADRVDRICAGRILLGMLGRDVSMRQVAEGNGITYGAIYSRTKRLTKALREARVAA